MGQAHAQVDPIHLFVLACARELILASTSILSSDNKEWLYLNPELKYQQCDLQSLEVPLECVQLILELGERAKEIWNFYLFPLYL